MPSETQLSKAYSPADTEPGIRARWDVAGAFHAEPKRVLSGEKPPYCILIPPPNVTAALHLGHALNNTIQDILARAHRMMGFETLWMPGTDHAGIATQAVVERRVLQEEGKRRTDFKGEEGRAEFVAKIQAFKDEYEATILEQLKLMGCSCDWARLRFTMDEQCAAAVREAFFLLFKDGLIYRGKRLVNWDPVLQTAVADDECYEEEIDSQFYYLRYPLVHAHQEGKKPQSGPQPMTWSELARRGYAGADAHPGDEQAWVTVATTRPETYLGDTAVGVNPHDPRAKALRGLFAQLPLVNRIVPIIEDDYVVLPAAMQEDAEAAASDPKAQYATGFLKVTPAHDQNDYELGQRHSLPMVNIFSPEAKISDKHGWGDVGDAHLFVGLTREEGRKKVVQEFKARGLLEGIRPYRHSLKFSDRSKAVIEPYLSDQWYVKVTDDRLKGAALRALDQSPLRQQGAPLDHAGSTPSANSPVNTSLTFHPARYAKTYQTWHENIRDWCISRQLWWGHRIPVWSKRITITPENQRDLLDGGDLDILDNGHPIPAYPFGGTTSGADAARSVGFVWLVHRATQRRVTFAKWTIEERYMPWLFEGLDGEFDVYVCVNGSRGLEESLVEYGFVQDPDVLDTWFSSGLWPISTMGWPDPEVHNADLNRGLLEAFNPSSTLCTAREIITLWVSRMTMFNRYFMPEGWPSEQSGPKTLAGASGSSDARGRSAGPNSGLSTRDSALRLPLGRGNGPVPFRDVFIHAMIQDGEGRKMSKMLGNGVDPRDIIASHGADAMRFTLCHMTTQTQDVRMPVAKDAATGKNTSPKFDLGRNLCNKLWNAARLTISIFDKHRDLDSAAAGKQQSPDEPFSLIDRWMLSRLAASLDQINESLAGYQFSAYAQSVYDLLWRDFCDWYLEAIKPTINESRRQRAVLAHLFESILRILHPIIPFITEAIWEHIRAVETEPIEGVLLGPSEKGGLLATAAWPVLAPSLRDPIAEDRFERARTLITLIREVRAQQQVLPKRKIILHAPAALVGELASAGSLPYIESLAGLEPVAGQPPAPPPGVPAVMIRFENQDLALSGLADTLNAAADQERIARRIAELTKSRTPLLKRLENSGYMAKAPPNLVAETRAQLAEIEAELERLQSE